MDRTAHAVRAAIACAALLLGFTIQSSVANAAVGRTVGAAEVSSTGEAQYTIPIFTPPGANKLTPSLAFQYGHRRGDGLLGTGWEISGLSVISRCNKTMAQEDEAAAPKRIAGDAYCLDGQRLRKTAGTYGLANSTYQTEIETFSRIKALNDAGATNSAWEVHTKDGLIYKYGGTSDSRIETIGSTVARTWALNEIRDRAGNTISIVYTEDTTNGSFRPDEIQYTTNSGAGVSTAPYTIKYVYESVSRPDVIRGYRMGDSSATGVVDEFKRLDRLDVLYNTSTVVRRYELTYNSAASTAGRTLLDSIQECAGTTDCYPATTFTYEDNDPGFVSSEVSAGITIPAGVTPLVLDINGDGLDDLAWSSHATGGSGTWYYAFADESSGTGYGSAQNSGISNQNYEYAQPFDWDNDSDTDIHLPCPTTSKWCIIRSSSSGLDTPLNTNVNAAVFGACLASDANGDGLDDHVCYSSEGADTLRVRLNTGGALASSVVWWTADGVTTLNGSSSFDAEKNRRQRSSLRKLDVDGDGDEDLFLTITKTSPSGTYDAVFLSTGSSYTLTQPRSVVNTPHLIGDFNGDGFGDVLNAAASSGNSFSVRFGRGSETTAAASFSATPANFVAGSTIVADYDEDGLSDVLVAAGTSPTWWYARATGSSFASFVDTGLSAANATTAFVHQLNADARADIGRIASGTGTVNWRAHEGESADFLESATDGLGNEVEFAYEALGGSSANNCHTRDGGALYQLQPAALTDSRDIFTACSLTSTDGIGGTYSLSYEYYNGGYDRAGRGFLGFSKRTVTDSRKSSLLTEEEYAQNPANRQYIGLLLTERLRQMPSTTLVESTANTLSGFVYGTGHSERRLPYLSSSTTSKYELGAMALT